MKRRFITGWLVALGPFAAGISTPALAHRIVHVEGSLYVIVCDPYGNAFSHVGNPTGAEELGKLLCPASQPGPDVGVDPGKDWKTINARPTREALRELPWQGGGLPAADAKVPVSRKASSGAGERNTHTPAHEAAHTVQQASGK